MWFHSGGNNSNTSLYYLSFLTALIDRLHELHGTYQFQSVVLNSGIINPDVCGGLLVLHAIALTLSC